MVENKKNNEEGIKAIAQALRAGGTLLNAACPVCDSPLIKINDKIYCKVCDREVLIYRDESELPTEIQKAMKRTTAHSANTQNSAIAITLNKKIEAMRIKLENTDDPDEIIKISEAIDKLLNTLQKIE
ncbi:MAG: Spo0E family sporulation regulatory protein-aspartic acid phosphatase [Asgard group archaeon]|nr:Spo0E family sporulation regulatory protein-aspartic acid phosphatase [Asgard group archaeon]